MAPICFFCKFPVLILFTILSTCFQCAVTYGNFEIKFLIYKDSCQEFAASYQCDPLFTFCLGRPTSDTCWYRTAKAKEDFHDTNYINMESMTDINGIPNPWIVYISSLMDPSVRLTVTVEDADPGVDDAMVTFTIDLSVPLESTEAWSKVIELTALTSYYISLQYRFVCYLNYYGQLCDKYCAPQNKSIGHYRCEAGTGKKICLQGWKGSDCADDIDECTQGYCVKGTCQNLPGDVTCICPDNYSGKNCSQACQFTPCEHDGCNLRPCANNGTCIDITNKTAICVCQSPLTGPYCETLMTLPPTTTTEAMLNTTAAPNTETGDQTQIEEEGFKPWYGAIIGVVIIVLIVAAVFTSVMVKRKRASQGQPEVKPTPTLAAKSRKEKLAFENKSCY